MNDHIESAPSIVFPVRITNLFWSHVLKTDGCWLWTGYKSPSGYGVFKPGSSTVYTKSWRAHRFAWRITNGAIPNGMFVCHHCDNPSCVNPLHLFVGTPRDNTLD